MGEVHSRAYLQAADRFRDTGIRPRLVLCADEVEARARDGQQHFGFEGFTTDWRQVPVHPEVEIVDITTPNYLHLEMVREAARARKHIFCEKPVGRSPRETAEIERAAREAGVLTFVGYNYRWCPLVQQARQWIEQGQLGKLTHYRGRFFAGYGGDPDAVLSWRFQQELAGFGVLGDLMSHVVDMAHLMAGPIRRVVGNRETFIPRRPLPTPGAGTHFTVQREGRQADVTNEDYAGALVEFANGAQGTLEACRVIRGPQCQMAFEVHGTRGAIRWDFERMNEIELFSLDQHNGREGYTRIVSGPQHPFHDRFNPARGVGLSYEDLKTIEAHHFLKSVVEGKQGEPGFQEALAVAEVLGAMERSWGSGRWENVR